MYCEGDFLNYIRSVWLTALTALCSCQWLGGKRSWRQLPEKERKQIVDFLKPIERIRD